MRNQRITIPTPYIAVILVYAFLSMSYMSLLDGLEPTKSGLALIVLYAIGAGIFTYGCIVLRANYKVGKTMKGIKREIKKNIDDANGA